MTGVQTCALPICFPVTIHRQQRTRPNKQLPLCQKHAHSRHRKQSSTKNKRRQALAESILAFANEEKRKSQEILQKEEASIQQYLDMEKPVLVVSDGECMEIVDISEYEEIQGMSDEEALLWYRQMRISKAMESFIKSDFYGDDFGLMCLRMREEIKALYEWIAEAKKKYPELPDVPDYEDDDEQVDRLYEKAVLCDSSVVMAKPKRIICTTGIPNNISIVRRSRKM